jgi:predicted nucleotidyltransferase component of viral defense system
MTATQIKDLLNNMSKKTGVNPQILQRNFMMERLLERISLSKHKNKFILKGGMLVAAMVGVDSRSTLDLDATIKGTLLTEETVSEIFNTLVQMDIGDDVTMTVKRIGEIREEFDYSCFRISIEAKVGNTIIPLKVDVSAGDVITPSEVKYKFNLLLEKRTIEILAYNLETVLAEKMETLISKGVFNTRMRDFYDLYILTTLRYEVIDIGILAKAIQKTAASRGTIVDHNLTEKNLDEIFRSRTMMKLWQDYQIMFSYAKSVSWKDIEFKVRELFGKVMKT